MNKSIQEVIDGIENHQKVFLENQKSAISEALKPSAYTQKIIDQMTETMSGLRSTNISKYSSPCLDPPVPPVPFARPSQQEINSYKSASVLMKALADEALQWKRRIPENYKPAIIALLYGGIQIHVNNLSQVSFHGIRVEGTLNGAPCSILAHQSTIQLLCFSEEINTENQKNSIGFIWGDNKIEV